MRLIDADALREYIYGCDGPMTHKAVAKAIAMAPTASCGECEFEVFERHRCRLGHTTATDRPCPNFERKS